MGASAGGSGAVSGGSMVEVSKNFPQAAAALSAVGGGGVASTD